MKIFGCLVILMSAIAHASETQGKELANISCVQYLDLDDDPTLSVTFKADPNESGAVLVTVEERSRYTGDIHFLPITIDQQMLIEGQANNVLLVDASGEQQVSAITFGPDLNKTKLLGKIYFGDKAYPLNCTRTN